jgi:hypothetical protein
MNPATIDRQEALDLHAKVLAAFDLGTKLPPTGRDRTRFTPEGKVILFSPRYFHVRSDELTVFDPFLATIVNEAADLERSGEYQVTTFIGEGYVAAVASSVLENELGVQYRDDITCFWRIGDRRAI